MAGKSQHHVWQLIQRGFGVKRGKHFHVWVYEKDQKPRQTSTRKYGTEDYFLTEDEDVTADIVLTNFENKTQGIVHSIREMPDGSKLCSQTMAPIVSYLEMRTLFLRQEISRLGERLFEGIAEVFGSRKNVKRLLANHIEKNPTLINDKLDEMELDGPQRAIAIAYIEHEIPRLIEAGSGEAARYAHALTGPLIAKLPEIVKKSHMKSIVSGFTEIERTRTHNNFCFIVKKSEIPLILPDTGLAFLKEKGMTPISQKDDAITDVIIPLSQDTYVHGYRKTYNIRSDKLIQKILASCAFETFIAPVENLHFSALASHIGKNARLISDTELKKIISINSLL